MADRAAQAIRERIWITKFDHATDPPRAVEEVFVENGVIMETRDLTGDPDEARERQEIVAADVGELAIDEIVQPVAEPPAPGPDAPEATPEPAAARAPVGVPEPADEVVEPVAGDVAPAGTPGRPMDGPARRDAEHRRWN